MQSWRLRMDKKTRKVQDRKNTRRGVGERGFLVKVFLIDTEAFGEIAAYLQNILQNARRSSIIGEIKLQQSRRQASQMKTLDNVGK